MIASNHKEKKRKKISVTYIVFFSWKGLIYKTPTNLIPFIWDLGNKSNYFVENCLLWLGNELHCSRWSKANVSMQYKCLFERCWLHCPYLHKAVQIRSLSPVSLLVKMKKLSWIGVLFQNCSKWMTKGFLWICFHLAFFSFSSLKRCIDFLQ